MIRVGVAVNGQCCIGPGLPSVEVVVVFCGR